MYRELDGLIDGTPAQQEWPWLITDDRRGRYVSIALGRISNWWLGQRIDPESKKSQLLHAAAALLVAASIED